MLASRLARPGGRHRRGAGLQACEADASALTAYALQSAVDTSLEVDSKTATALLDAVATAALDAALLGKADSTVDGLDTPLEVDNALLGCLGSAGPPPS